MILKSIVGVVTCICLLLCSCTNEFHASSPKQTAAVKQPIATKSDDKPIAVAVDDAHRAWIVYDKSFWQINLNESRWRCLAKLSHAENVVDEEHFRGLLLQNANSVWLISNRQLIRSTNGGESWIPMLKLDGLSRVNSLYFIDKLQGWAIGGEFVAPITKPFMVYTSDGGQTWVEKELFHKDDNNSPYGIELYSMFFLNSSVGWLSGSGKIWMTNDSGNNWKPLAIKIDQETNIKLSKLHFFDEMNGYAVYSPVKGAIPYDLVKTTDGGRSWKIVKLLSGFVTSGLSDFHFFTLNHGLVVFQGRIIETNDGGRSWKRIDIQNELPVDLIRFLDAKTGLAIGQNQTLSVTYDGGRSWHGIK